MDSDLGDRYILQWEPTDVNKWLSSIGFSQYESQLKGAFVARSPLLLDLQATDHDVDGQAFVLLNPEALKELGVSSIGQRLAILKAIYQLKIANHIQIDEDHYVPPCKHRKRELELLFKMFDSGNS
jgi:bZIP factor